MFADAVRKRARWVATVGVLLTSGLVSAGCETPCSDYGLYTIRADGSDRSRLALAGSGVEEELDVADVGYATWLPGGRRIAFSLCTWWTANSDGSDVQWPGHNPTREAAGVRLLWIPKKEAPKFGRLLPPDVLGFEIVRGGRTTKRVFFGPESDYEGGSGCAGVTYAYRAPAPSMGPRLTLDGSGVVYVDDVDTSQYGLNREIFTVSTHGGSRPRRLTWTPDRDERSAAWSREGRRIAYVSEWLVRGPTHDSWRTAVHAMNADGSGDRVISETAGDVAWSPDGNAVVILRDRDTGDGEELAVVDLRGNLIQRLTSGRELHDITWAPSDRIAYVENKGDSSQDKCDE